MCLTSKSVLPSMPVLHLLFMSSPHKSSGTEWRCRSRTFCPGNVASEQNRRQPSFPGSGEGETGFRWEFGPGALDVFFHPKSPWCYNPHNISLGELLFSKCKIEVQSIKVLSSLTVLSLVGLAVKLGSFASGIVFYVMDFTVRTVWECLLQRFPNLSRTFYH